MTQNKMEVMREFESNITKSINNAYKIVVNDDIDYELMDFSNACNDAVSYMREFLDEPTITNHQRVTKSLTKLIKKSLEVKNHCHIVRYIGGSQLCD